MGLRVDGQQSTHGSQITPDNRFGTDARVYKASTWLRVDGTPSRVVPIRLLGLLTTIFVEDIFELQKVPD